ncbi:MAG: ATP-binding protein [Patescibacteria group bacterium]|nr:ATP-binding protein [Patescibacteria group bacterium]
MHNLRPSTILPCVALMVSIAIGAAWVFDWPLFDKSVLGRASFLAFGVLLAGLAAAGWAANLQRARHQFERYVAALCEMGHGGSASDRQCDQLPPLSSNHPWRGTAEQIGAVLRDYRTRLRDLEHSRAALEIRCGRATAQYEKIQCIFEGLAEPVLAIDDYDELVLANASAEALLNIGHEKVETKAVRQLVHCEKLLELLTSTAHRQIPGDRTEEVEIADADGTPHWFRATATKLIAPDVEHSHADLSARGAVAVLRDIGEHKALQKRNAEFVSAVSHEMKTPLAGIKAYVELLADGEAEDDATREEFLEVINSQADRLQRLVENLLNIARIEAGVVNVSKASQSLNEILEEAMHVVQPAAEAKAINLVNELSPLYLGVLADRDMLLQAAINLLSNAVKYTPGGGTVTLRSRMDDHEVRFEVEDTGVGLSETDCQRVFEKFYRVKKDKDMASGTGLGLPLAKHIVEDVHRGCLTVASREGEGTVFAVVLPCLGQMDTGNRSGRATADR